MPAPIFGILLSFRPIVDGSKMGGVLEGINPFSTVRIQKRDVVERTVEDDRPLRGRVGNPESKDDNGKKERAEALSFA